jgi:hypothetical protein
MSKKVKKVKKFKKGDINSLKVGTLYHSKQNNKVVRLVELHIKERIAVVKHHKQDHLFQAEVFYMDLEVATGEQVKAYFQR